MSALKSLPAELRMQIVLCLPDLQSLRALSLSSRPYHQVYCLVRPEALLNVLHNQYDGLVDITESIAAARSKKLHGSRKRDRDDIIALLDARRRSDEIRCRRKQSRDTAHTLPYKPTSFNEVLALLKLPDRTALCPFWMDENKWKNEVLPLEFSRTEKMRYFRAFYRLETHCNLFGAGEHHVYRPWPRSYYQWDKHFSREDAWRLFFGPYPPWEIEEFGRLWQHLYERNFERFHEVAQDMLQYGSDWIGSSLPEHIKALPSCSVCDCDDLSIKDHNVRESLASLGPTFLLKLLQEEDFITRRNMILANGRCYYESFRNLVATLPSTERPNLAWEKIWIDTLQENEPIFEEAF
ncbi:hypothetical protein BJX99DRAFT_248556 [Aspergillus californicus]